MKKTWTIVITAILVLSLILAGCSSNKKDGNAANSASPNNTSGQASPDAVAEKVKINVFADQDTGVDLKTNSFTKLVEDKFNIQFNWTAVPKTEGAAEKRNISFASGDIPDLYLLINFVDKFTQAEILKFSKQGVIVPLNDLIDQYAPNIKNALESNEVYKAVNTAPDGKIYALSQLNECYHCSYPNKMWLNTKWLKQLGLSEPKTTEEFRNVLKAFKTKDPNGNGKADEVPLSGSKEDFGVHVIPYLMNSFIYDDDKTYLTMKDGKADTATNKPEWKEGLAYIKSLYDEGLIDIGGFTQDAETFKKLGNNNPQLLGAGTALLSGIFIDLQGPYVKDYNPIAPLQGPHTSYATYSNTIKFEGIFALTNKASKEVQIAAIKMLDYLYTPEGRLRGSEGEEGVSWVKPEAGDVALNEKVQPLFKRIPSKPDDKPRNDSWGGALAGYYQDRAYRDAIVQGKDIYAKDMTGLERQLYQATLLYEGKQPEEVFPNGALWVDPAVADELSMMQTNIKDYIDQNALQFVTGSKSLDKDWDAYVKGLEKLNLKRYLEIMQAAYDSSTIKK